ncbi:hypothetical protein BH11BAC4_BH11BAC4_21640 [soil metagenome]
MKQKLLFTAIAASVMFAANAQKQSQRTVAYLITSPEKGAPGWTEVKLVDLQTGEEIQSVYRSDSETEALNARTKKPVVKYDEAAKIPHKKIIVLPASTNEQGVRIAERRIEVYETSMLKVDKPFATSSAACAYDKKHERLYYTPMGINQLRYIDLRSNTIYYFEDEPFGALKGAGDVQNQVTRMVIAADGNGYALTNNGEHLVQFTTNKKATITDLGTLTDDAANKVSIHNRGGFGGDMVADEAGNLYVITANRNVFKVNIESRVAVFTGTIKGLPAGFTANGAAVENGRNIIISSATTTTGYYKFNLEKLQAEKFSTPNSVYNAADLANATLVKADERKDDAVKPITEIASAEKIIPPGTEGKEKIAVYPNPVTTGSVKINFTDYLAGNYELQLIDLTGKVISTQALLINNKTQVYEYKLPGQLANGAYLLKIVGSNNRIVNTEKLIIE